MKIRGFLISALLSAALWGSAATAQETTLYTWVDADGTVHYSDKPEHPSAQPVGLKSRGTDPARVANELATRAAREEERALALADATEAAAEEAREDADRQQRCEQAQARLRTLTVARRPFRVDDEGQQIYLDDAQINAEQAEARALVSELCR